MTLQACFVMDPIEHIKYYKDTTFAFMIEAQKRGWTIYTLGINDLFILNGVVFGTMRPIQVQDDPLQWFEYLGAPINKPLHKLDVTFMRKDPPVDLAYIYATQLLEIAERKGHLVVNNPKSLRDANEKLFATWFPNLCPPTLVTSKIAQIEDFLQTHKTIVVKPLDSMGGHSVFLIQDYEPNRHVILENMTHQQLLPIMAQKYIPDAKRGDKRILIIDGKPYPYALLRVPKEGEFRGNLAVGSTGVGTELTKKEIEICEAIGPTLKTMGLLFVGLDVIGELVTEINVTSPTCVREIDAAFSVNISASVLDAIEKKLKPTP